MDLLTPIQARFGISLRRLTVRQYERMAEVGILAPDERVELLDGVIFAVSPQGEPHAEVIERLTVALVRALASNYRIRPQLPLEASRYSEPEPDFAILDRSEGTKGERPKHAEWIIEVAHSSLRLDRNLKSRIYARNGVPEYWIINVEEQCIEVYRQPNRKTGLYKSSRTIRAGEKVKPQRLPGPTIDVAALFA